MVFPSKKDIVARIVGNAYSSYQITKCMETVKIGTMANTSKLTVFQDLHLRGSTVDRSRLREALLKLTQSPWRHAKEKEVELAALSGGEEKILFERKPSDDLVGVGLVLWSTSDGYEVTNIVPLEAGELSYEKYNAILINFTEKIAAPAAKESGFSVELSEPELAITAWLSSSTAQRLQSFSYLANKSTGASHPSDRKRWFDFLIAAYLEGAKLDVSTLRRWLVEIENWPEEIALELAIDYEFSSDLLQRYDSSR
jgi:hypothetical protein